MKLSGFFGISAGGSFRAASLRVIIPVCVNVSDVRPELFSAFHSRHGAAYDGARKRQVIRDLTDNAWSLLAQYEAELQNGDFSEKEARKKGHEPYSQIALRAGRKRLFLDY